jgi:hypothetical protein
MLQEADESLAKERARGSLVELVGRWPTAQAVFAAIVAASELALTQKQGATMVAAAARGAVQGYTAGVINKDVEQNLPVIAQEMSLHVLGVKGLPQAMELLRRNGEHALAKRLSRQSKARNGVAHPDVGLVSHLEAFMHKMNQKISTGPDVFFIGEAPEDGVLAASSSGCIDYLESASQANARDRTEESSPESVGMGEEVGAPGAAKVIKQWADMFSSDSGSENLEELTAPPRNGSKTDWLEVASQRERCEVQKLMTIFGSNGSQHQDVDPTFEWLPKPVFDNGVADGEGSDDLALSAFLDALTEAFCSGREWAGPAKMHLGHFVRARVSDGDDRASALKEGMEVLREVLAVLKKERGGESI